MTTLAIDIGGTKLAAALIDTQHRLLEKRALPTPASKTPAALTEALSALVAARASIDTFGMICTVSVRYQCPSPERIM